MEWNASEMKWNRRNRMRMTKGWCFTGKDLNPGLLLTRPLTRLKPPPYSAHPPSSNFISSEICCLDLITLTFTGTKYMVLFTRLIFPDYDQSLLFILGIVPRAKHLSESRLLVGVRVFSRSIRICFACSTIRFAFCRSITQSNIAKEER